MRVNHHRDFGLFGVFIGRAHETEVDWRADRGCGAERSFRLFVGKWRAIVSPRMPTAD